MIKKIDSDDLTGVMLLLDSARVILNEVHFEFFDVLNPDTEREAIAYQMPTARARSNAVTFLLGDAVAALRELGASEGYPGESKSSTHEEVQCHG